MWPTITYDDVYLWIHREPGAEQKFKDISNAYEVTTM